MRRSISSSVVALFAVALLTAGCDARKLVQDAAPPQTLASVLASTPDLSLLSEAVKQIPSLQSAAENPDTAVTVFAPSNQAFQNAFAALGAADLGALVSNGVPVGDIISYHIVGAPVLSTQLQHGAPIFTFLEGKRLISDLEAGNAPIIRGFNSAANVTQADVPAGKCVVHVVDSVLLPFNPFPPAYGNIAEAAVAANLTALVAALEKANLTSAFANPDLEATVLAPTDQAFAAALTGLNATLDSISVDVLTKVLTYHVAPGYGPTARMVANGTVKTMLANQTLTWVYPTKEAGVPIVSAYGSNATIVTKDVFAGNSGVIHVIDTVLIPNLS